MNIIVKLWFHLHYISLWEKKEKASMNLSNFSRKKIMQKDGKYRIIIHENFIFNNEKLKIYFAEKTFNSN